MATGTVYKPCRTDSFDATKIQFSGKGICGVCEVVDITSITPKIIDMPLSDDYLLTGGQLIVKGANIKDHVSLQVVLPDGTILSEFITQFRMVEDSDKQFEFNNNYPAKIYAGLVLRIIYQPAAIVGVRDIALNYYLHKVLA